MEVYDQVAQSTAKGLTMAYSTSFSMASRLFLASVQPHIYNIYGLVRLADEIVDTYVGSNKLQLLNGLEADIERALANNYSPNLIVHAFALTARQYNIGQELTGPFFASMRMDLYKVQPGRDSYETYIYGSAEVIGLMCLRVFCGSNIALFDELAPGARRLGAAYQKINFLRDVTKDREILGRVYLPELQSGSGILNDDAKTTTIADIKRDFAAARPAIAKLPHSAKPAVEASYRYYWQLLNRLEAASAADIEVQRVRLPNAYKLVLLLRSAILASFYRQT